MAAFKVWNNSPRMNLPQAFYVNIQANPYFKNLIRLKTYHEVIHEIKQEVKNLEPRIKGTELPSTPWCLLFKLFTLKLSENQLTDMLDNEPSPFVRGMAMIYIRLTCPPGEMWDWFESYLIDDHEIPVYNNGKTIAMGNLVKLLIEEQKFCGLFLPRIPVPIHRDMVEKLGQRAHELPVSNSPPKERKKESSGRRERDFRGSSPPRKRRRSTSPSNRNERRDYSYSRDYDRRDRDREYERDRRDRYDRDQDRYEGRSDKYRSSRRDRRDYRGRERDEGRRNYRDRRREDGGRDRDRYQRERSPPPREEDMGQQEKIEISDHTKDTKSNPNLDKLKELYGAPSSSTKNVPSTYGDSLGEDVVRIGF